MTRVTAAIGVVACTLAVLPPAAAPAQTGSRAVLDRLYSSVQAFSSEYERLVGIEHYTQRLTGPRTASRARQLVSEVFFFGGDERGGAMTVRSVISVDGKEQAPAARAIADALALPASDRFTKLKALADAGARYNLGSLRRNFNDPTLALMLASQGYRSRFRFDVDGREAMGGHLLHGVRFRERDRPTLIRNGRTGRDIPASGVLWTDEDGIVWRTELRLEKDDIAATVVTDFDRDGRLGVMVPVSMREDYRYRDPDDKRLMTVTGEAIYSDFRRFETSARILDR
jgi:hypothetical protein